MRTKAGNFILSSDVSTADQTYVTVTHNDPGTATIEYDYGASYTLTSAAAHGRYWANDWSEPLFIRFSTFTAYATELEIDGMIGLRVDQIPSQLTRFEHSGGYHTFDGLTMGGSSLPSGLVDLHVENVRSPADVDRIITALEANGASSGNLFLAEQTLSKTTDLLESRSWDVEVEPQFAHKVERSKAPHTSIIDGKAVHHVDRRRGGDRRKQWEGRCIELNGTSERAETNSSFVWTGADALTILVWVKATDSGFVIGHWNSGTTYTALVQILSGGLPRVYISMDGTASNFRYVQDSADIRDGQWHHIALRYQAGTLEGYLDGALFDGSVSTTGSGTTINQTASTLVVGADTGGAGTDEFPGKVDDPMVFDTALPASEIAARAAMKPQSPPPSLSSVPLIWLPMDDATSSPIIRNHGSLGAAGDFTLAGTPSSIWTTSDRYSYPNEHSCSSGLVTNGVSGYIDTGVTLDSATAFTVLKEVRYLSTDAYDLDGFFNNLGSTVRLGRDNGNSQVYANPGVHDVNLTPGTSVLNGENTTISLKAAVGGNYDLRVNGVSVSSGSSTMSAISNAKNYLIGVSDSTTVTHYGHRETTRYLIASRVLTDDEITYWRTRGASGTAFDSATDADILVDYDFQSPHPRTVHNIADPGNPGKIVGDCEWVAINHDAADTSKDMNGKPLTWTGPVPRDSVISSPAAELNGTSDGWTLPVDLSSATSWSFSCRFKTADTDAYLMDARDANDDGYRIYFGGNSEGKIVVSSDATDVETADEGWDDDEWHFAEVEWSGSNVTIKVDGIQYASGAMAAASALSMTTVTIGERSFTQPASNLAGQIADIEMYVDGSKVGTWPCCESSGDICWDISGSGNHGTGAPSSRTGSQNASDVLIGSGFAKGTHFDGSSDSLDATGRITSGAVSELSACCWAVMDSAKVQTICSEYLFTGNQRSWNWRFNASRQMELVASPDGTGGATQATSPVVAALGQLVHVGFSYSAGTIKWYVNGALVETDTGAYASFGDVTCNFMIGNTLTAQFLHGMLSKLVIEQAVWSDAEFASLKAATDEASILAIRPGATVYIDGGISDSSLTVVGAPEERIIPAGAGVPISYGPGVPAPGQSRLVAAEPNSPFALRYAGSSELTQGEAAGDTGDRQLFVNSDDTGALYESQLSVEMADIIATRKYS